MAKKDFKDFHDKKASLNFLLFFVVLLVLFLLVFFIYKNVNISVSLNKKVNSNNINTNTNDERNNNDSSSEKFNSNSDNSNINSDSSNNGSSHSSSNSDSSSSGSNFKNSSEGIGEEIFYVPFCGDGVCSNNENENNCCSDCGCSSGACVNNICPFNVSLNFNTNFVLATNLSAFNNTTNNNSESEKLIDKIYSNEYLVVTITSVKKISNRKFDGNKGEEFLLFTYAKDKEGIQEFKFPMKGTFNKMYVPNGEQTLFNINVEKFGKESQVPVYSRTLSSIEDNPVFIRFVVFEVDKKGVDPILKYSEDLNAILSSLFSKGDVALNIEKKIDKNHLGEFTIKTDDIELKYKVQILKGLSGVNNKYSIILKSAFLKNALYTKNPLYPNEGYFKVGVYSRTAQNFEWNGFGVSSIYNNEQQTTSSRYNYPVGSIFARSFDIAHQGSSIGGPFVYFEVDYFDMEHCKNDDSETWVCYATIDYSNVDYIKRFYTAEDLVDLYEEEIRDFDVVSHGKFIDSNISVRLTDFH